MLNTFQTSFQTTGSVISLTFATLFSKDARVLAISDGVLIGSTFICVLFGKLLQKGWLRYWPTLIWVQHAWQAAMLGAVVKWTRYRLVTSREVKSGDPIELLTPCFLLPVNGLGFNPDSSFFILYQ